MTSPGPGVSYNLWHPRSLANPPPHIPVVLSPRLGEAHSRDGTGFHRGSKMCTKPSLSSGSSAGRQKGWADCACLAQLEARAPDRDGAGGPPAAYSSTIVRESPGFLWLFKLSQVCFKAWPLGGTPHTPHGSAWGPEARLLGHICYNP